MTNVRYVKYVVNPLDTAKIDDATHSSKNSRQEARNLFLRSVLLAKSLLKSSRSRSRYTHLHAEQILLPRMLIDPH